MIKISQAGFFHSFFLISMVKTALNMMGMGAGAFRMPLCEMDEANAKRLEKALKDYGVL